MPLRILWLALAAVLALPAAAAAAAPSKPAAHHKAAPARLRTTGPRFGARADLRAFAADVAARHGLERSWVLEQLAQAQKVQAVRQLIMPPPAGQAKDWAAYRERFVEPRRIGAGAAFWQLNEDALRRAEQRYGVPASIIVGILGVETYFGRLTGAFRVIDALTTLGFDFPPGRKDRSEFFRAELEEFLVMCRREGLDAQALKGSYAGAIGLAQFMPSSIARYAVDFDGDGRTDVGTSHADAIGSIAHYLAESGWQRGRPTHFELAPPPDDAERAALLLADIRPRFTAAQFAEHGAVLAAEGRAYDGALALVELQNGDGAPSYVAGTQNFYALTRYNWSSYYAMAVITLGEAVAAARAEAERPLTASDPPGR